MAYGDEDGWNSLSESEQQEALAQDAVIRDRGNLISAVQTKVTSVKNWDEHLEVTDDPLAQPPLPLARFSVIEAESLDEVIEFVKDTPCPRARGFIEYGRFGTLAKMGHDKRPLIQLFGRWLSVHLRTNRMYRGVGSSHLNSG